MTTAKNTTKNKVTNSQATHRKGKNQMAENLIRRTFEPLTSSKDGKGRLTFCGVEHSVSKDGTNPFMKLVFSVLDITHESAANIAILTSYRYSENNKLGKILTMMGYVAPAIEYEIIDEDDEFGHRAKVDDITGVFDFLREKCGLVYKGNLERLDSGLYRIDVGTLSPILDKSGEQLKDYLASDVTDDSFENPHIDIDDHEQG